MMPADDTAAELQALLAGLSSEGERHLGEIQADLRQTSYLLNAAIDKLGKSFLGIHETMTAQQALQADALPAPAMQEQLAHLAAQSRSHADAAITALQFEDMTAQLIGRILGHVESLQAAFGTVGAGAAALAQVQTLVPMPVPVPMQPQVPPPLPAQPAAAQAAALPQGATVAAVLASVNRLLDAQRAEAPAKVKKTVAQTHLDSGDIELF